MTLSAFLERAELSPEELYRPAKSFTALKRIRARLDGASAEISEPSASTAAAFRALPRLLHIDDPARLGTWQR